MKTKPSPRSAPKSGVKPQPNSALRTPPSQVVLLAVTGMSPAVLTETIWALAHSKPAVIPHRVVAITTLPGKTRIEDELFRPLPDYGGLSVWQALRRVVLGGGFESDPRLNLDEVRGIAQRDPTLGRYPGTFSALVRAYSDRIEEISGPPEVALADDDLSLRVNGVRVVLAAREFAVFTFLLERCRDGAPPYRQQKEAVDDFKAWLAAWGKRRGWPV